MRDDRSRRHDETPRRRAGELFTAVLFTAALLLAGPLAGCVAPEDEPSPPAAAAAEGTAGESPAQAAGGADEAAGSGSGGLVPAGPGNPDGGLEDENPGAGPDDPAVDGGGMDGGDAGDGGTENGGTGDGGTADGDGAADREEEDEPLIPQGFEDVAPATGELVDGPFTGGEDADGDDGSGGGETAFRNGAYDPPLELDAVWVFLVEPEDSPPASALGRGEAGSGERRSPDPRTDGEYAGSFGCGDQLRGLRVELDEPTRVADRAEHVALVLRTLLDLSREAVPGDLMNSLRRSSLEVESVEAAPERPGVYRVRLGGNLRVGGTCDTPRVRAQLVITGQQVEDVDEVEVFLGDQPLDVVLSSRGTVQR